MSASISARRLRSPYPIVIRAVRGPADLAVVINQDTAGLTAALWHGQARTLQPLAFDHATYATTATPDGRHLLDLDDPTGSEVGHLHAFPIDGGDAVDLTPHLGAYTIRGIDCATDGRTVLVTGADESGFFVLVTSIESPETSRVIFHSPNESWSGILSAEAAMVALETTDHNPGVRRFAVTVLDTATGDRLATLSDGPVGPIRPVRFAQEPGMGPGQRHAYRHPPG
ncbi:MAG: hypothetical protein NTX29_10660 [Actinobacteria bacterium]|nr:hypothetical protein [Actinomycetota bacterium]